VFRIFGVPAILGAIVTPIFYYLFRHIDNEEYTLASVEEEAGVEPGFKELAREHDEAQREHGVTGTQRPH
jgi:hypothetical protein